MFPLVGYMLLFVAIGVGFILVHLIVGKLVRPDRPHQEKDTIYECGEPTIGSAWGQFDLRFYVIALLFVIFDVEVAFFFPWAVVFGKANTLANNTGSEEQRLEAAFMLAPEKLAERDALQKKRRQLENTTDHLEDPSLAAQREEDIAKTEQRLATLKSEVLYDTEANKAVAGSLAWFALWDILVFFGVLLVGFAYLWKRGDLHWVKAVTSDSAKPLARVQQSTAQTVGSGS